MKEVLLGIALVISAASFGLLFLHKLTNKEKVIKSKVKVKPSMEMIYTPTVDSFTVDTVYIYKFK